MLSILKKIFDDTVEQRQPDGPPLAENAFQVAACALLLEVANADENLDDDEQRTLLEILKKEFDLSEALVQELIELAGDRRDESASYWRFARTVKDKCSPAEREHMLELMWKVVYADRVLEGHEDSFMRQCAGALNLPHDALIRAKLRALPDE